VIDQHAAILAHVADHDFDGTEDAMHDHLAQTARDLRAAFVLIDGTRRGS